MKNLGFGCDGGSSYTSLSYLDEEGGLHPFTMQGQDSPCWPSCAAYREARSSYEFAFQTRQHAGRRGYRWWNGWKLLLAKSDPQMLAERGYDEGFTPHEICRRFYEYLFSTLARNFNLSQLEEVAVGVPESWLREKDTLDARMELLDICQELNQVKRVRLVSEPVAACAYYVHKYRQETGQPFRGYSFIFDAGGGTLDLTICEADENGPRSRIKSIFRDGVGENTDRTLGTSGIAYMEETVLTALEKHTGQKASEIVRGPKFQGYVREVEAILLSDSGENLESRAAQEGEECCRISDNLRYLREAYAFGGMEEVEEPAFAIDYFGLDGQEAEEGELEFSYGVLAQAYQNRIAPVIQQKLSAVRNFLNSQKIHWTAADAGEQEASGEGLFRVILCGGFCNFPLVEAQVREELGWLPLGDCRFGQELARDERTMAVSYGLTLVANHVIDVIQTSPFSVGFCLNGGTDLYAIEKNSVVQEGVPCYLSGPDGKPLVCVGRRITEIVFNLTLDPALKQKVKIAKALEEQFTIDDETMFYIGFSLDESLILSLHISPVTVVYDESVFPIKTEFVERGEPEVRRLGALKDLYDGLAVLRPQEKKGES